MSDNLRKEEAQMKDCFGVRMGSFMEDMIGEVDEVRKCYACEDFDQCYKMSMIRVMTQLRFEMRRAAKVVGLAAGGAHSVHPF
ncbi:hypothetical protein HQ520_05605 [bacterium]|nr:hypothetical protein [bacterium]